MGVVGQSATRTDRLPIHSYFTSTVMGHRVDAELLKSIIAEVDADGSGELEFPEFVQLAAQFLIEEDAEEMQNELKEAFRLYDKEGNGYITTATLREIFTNWTT